VQDALHFFDVSGSVEPAVRLALASARAAIEDGGGAPPPAPLQARLFRLACRAPRESMLRAAAHFEECGEPERAVQLYRRAGETPRALALCFAPPAGGGGGSGLEEELRAITDELGVGADPEVRGH